MFIRCTYKVRNIKKTI